MKKKSASTSSGSSPGFLLLAGLALLFIAYSPLIFHPDLHTSCPENDTWNLPIRWSVLSSLRAGRLPLWNPLSAFGIPWLATWQTETFYPGTFLFTGLGLSAWNFSGLLHLVILSLGVYSFLRLEGVEPLWAFFSASIALLNGCAYNHLGSNSSMDTMAWTPWIFFAARNCLDRRPWGRFLLILFFVLQVFAGYPQIIFYTLVGVWAYAVFQKGWKAPAGFFLPIGAGLLLSAAQWIPSVEYFFINSVRLPAVHDNPSFFLPLENLKTFFNPNALAQNGFPDYVANPTFFYFNFYSGLLPLLILALGFLRFGTLKPVSRFFLLGFLFLVFWALGYVLMGLQALHIPYPAFLEPAKCWVLINFFELAALGLIAQDLFHQPAKWKWALLVLSAANLLYFTDLHPLERNLLPPDPQLELQAQTFKNHLGSGRILILPNPEYHGKLYTPLPDPDLKPLFKHFIPNSNYFEFLPTATFYGSTQPTWGALDAGFYFQYVFPKDNGALMDLLGVDLLYLPESRLPSHYRKIRSDGDWVLWENPSSLGSHFYFTGSAKNMDRKTLFTAFAQGKARPRRDLFVAPVPVSRAPSSPVAPLLRETFPAQGDYLVLTQNAVPGWRAWVDGVPADIFLADGIFQAIHLPKSAREVEVAYEPASFRLGLFLSLLALGGLFAGVGIKLRRLGL